MKELSHPNIVALKGVCRKPPVFCLVMEYCPKSLYDVIQNTRIAAPLALDWARQVTAGMEYLHSRNVIHRDLKVRLRNTPARRMRAPGVTERYMCSF